MHHAQNYVDANILPGPGGKLAGVVLTAGHASALTVCLQQDAANYCYSALVSVADALQGLQKKFYSWATVKLYYSVFYGLRGILAARRRCVFYEGSTPMWVDAAAGSQCSKGSGTTHKFVLTQFAKVVPTSPLLSPIGTSATVATEWMMQRREEVNYRRGRLSDPSTPAWFQRVDDLGLRFAVESYLQDADVLAYDPDHAILAYPIAVLRAAQNALKAGCGRLEVADIEFLASVVRDKVGGIASLVRFVGTFG